MKLVRGLSGGGARGGACVMTIGTYDGMHRGHRALLARLNEHAKQRGEPAVLLTFEPMPREFLTPNDPPARLTSLRERWRILSGTRLDYLWLLRFGEALRNLPGEAFAQLLARELAPKLVVVGHDFRFGHRGEGTAAVLAAAGTRLGFEVDVLAPVMLDGERVSSSGVRAALACGDFERARRWLGRPWSMRGRVMPGRRLGRDLGFPTANLPLERRRAPGFSRCACTGWEAARCRASPASAPARRSPETWRCWRRICSIFARTCTVARLKSSSRRSCATRHASRASRRSRRRCSAMQRMRAASSMAE